MNKFTKIGAVALAASALALSAHASAKASDTTKPTSVDKRGSTPAEAKKYCIDEVPATGSRVKRRECKTLAEWADEGVELPPKK